MNLLEHIGYRLARFLSKSDEEGQNVSTCSREELVAALKPGDVLLIDGNSRFSAAIKYLTQSTWSHATLFVGNVIDDTEENADKLFLIEADLTEGVRAVPLSRYCHMHTRICRAVGLSQNEIYRVIDFVLDRIGHSYDLKNIFDLARYMIQTPPFPRKHRRRLLALGSGEPTKAICSTLIAQAFQSVNYPILPTFDVDESSSKAAIESHQEILHIRHHSLFAPRDFDVSPYFQIVKPSLQKDFDPHQLRWAKEKKEQNE